MDMVKFIFDSTKDGAAWGLLAFSLVINCVLAWMVRTLWKTGQGRNDAVQGALNDIRVTLASILTALTFTPKRRR